MKVADGIKVENQLTLKEGGRVSWILGGSNVITRVLESGRGRQKRTSERCNLRRT